MSISASVPYIISANDNFNLSLISIQLTEIVWVRSWACSPQYLRFQQCPSVTFTVMFHHIPGFLDSTCLLSVVPSSNPFLLPFENLICLSTSAHILVPARNTPVPGIPSSESIVSCDLDCTYLQVRFYGLWIQLLLPIQGKRSSVLSKYITF